MCHYQCNHFVSCKCVEITEVKRCYQIHFGDPDSERSNPELITFNPCLRHMQLRHLGTLYSSFSRVQFATFKDHKALVCPENFNVPIPTGLNCHFRTLNVTWRFKGDDEYCPFCRTRPDDTFMYHVHLGALLYQAYVNQLLPYPLTRGNYRVTSPIKGIDLTRPGPTIFTFYQSGLDRAFSLLDPLPQVETYRDEDDREYVWYIPINRNSSASSFVGPGDQVSQATGAYQPSRVLNDMIVGGEINPSARAIFSSPCAIYWVHRDMLSNKYQHQYQKGDLQSTAAPAYLSEPTRYQDMIQSNFDPIASAVLRDQHAIVPRRPGRPRKSTALSPAQRLRTRYRSPTCVSKHRTPTTDGERDKAYHVSGLKRRNDSSAIVTEPGVPPADPVQIRPQTPAEPLYAVGPSLSQQYQMWVRQSKSRWSIACREPRVPIDEGICRIREDIKVNIKFQQGGS